MDILIYLVLLLTLFYNVFANGEQATEQNQEINLNINSQDSTSQSLITNFSFLNFILNNITSNTNVPISENSTEQFKHVICEKGLGNTTVDVVNRTEMLQLLLPYGNSTTTHQPGRCLLLFFYAPFCPFSCMAAPHFNALPRAFPDIKMAALDASLYQSFNTQYGIVGIPTLMLFHQGRPVAKFNNTEYTIESFVKFVTKYTKIKPIEKYFVTSADFFGPISSVPDKRTDYFLIMSWLFIVSCSTYYFSKSIWWKSIVESMKNNWRESEAQHEHAQ